MYVVTGFKKPKPPCGGLVRGVSRLNPLSDLASLLDRGLVVVDPRKKRDKTINYSTSPVASWGRQLLLGVSRWEVIRRGHPAKVVTLTLKPVRDGDMARRTPAFSFSDPGFDNKIIAEWRLFESFLHRQRPATSIGGIFALRPRGRMVHPQRFEPCCSRGVCRQLDSGLAATAVYDVYDGL